MSYYYTSVKRLAALRLRLSQLEGKLKFAIRRGIRKLILSALFAIDALERTIECLKSKEFTPIATDNNIRYVDRELALWEQAMQGLLPQWFVHNTNKSIADILLNKDTSFSTYQYKQYIDTGKCFGLLETVPKESATVKGGTVIGQSTPRKPSTPATVQAPIRVVEQPLVPQKQPTMTLQPCKTNRKMPYKKGDRVFFFDYYHYQTADKMKLATVTDDQSCFTEVNIQVDGEENIGDRWLSGRRRVKVRDIFDIYDDRDYTDYTLEATTTTATQAPTLKPQKQPTGFTVHCGQPIKVGSMTDDEKFAQYLDSLELPRLIGAQSPEQLKHCQHLRESFVRNSLYRLLAYDSRNPLLVFAPVILKLQKFKSALYWLESEDYQIRSDITWQATNKYYAAYPEKKHHLARCAKGRGRKSDRFFFTRKSSADQWEVWHYVG